MMRCLFYYSNSRFAFSAIAAAMHLGIIPHHPPYTPSAIKELPLRSRAGGTPLFSGTDRFGNKIYALWDAGEPELINNIIGSFSEMYGIPHQRVILLDLGIKDTALSLSAYFSTKIPGAPGYEPLVTKILNRYHPIIATAVGRNNNLNLTKTASYQIMLP